MLKIKENKENKNIGWDDISINKYYEIKHIFDRPDISELEKNIFVASSLFNVPADVIWNMPLEKAGEMFNKLDFLNEFNLKNIKKIKSFNDCITICDRKFKLITDVSKLSVAQYTDYQSFIQLNFELAIDKLLSVFIIPEGKSYNQDYDIVEVQKFFRDNMSFLLAQSLINFLLVKYFNSIIHSLKYLAKKMQREKNQMKKKEMEEMLIKMKENTLNLLCSIGCA